MCLNLIFGIEMERKGHIMLFCRFFGPSQELLLTRAHRLTEAPRAGARLSARTPCVQLHRHTVIRPVSPSLYTNLYEKCRFWL